MSFIKEGRQIYIIYMYLDASVLFLITKNVLGKFYAKFDGGIFIGYSNSSKVFRVFNKRTLTI